MQRKPLSTPLKGKGFNYFKYEMKDTNQLLKDMISCNMSDTVSRSVQNKQQNQYQDMFRDTITLRKIDNEANLDLKKRNSIKKFIQSQLHMKQMEKNFVKHQNQFQNDQNHIFNDFSQQKNANIKRKKADSSIESLILQKFYMDVSESSESQEFGKNATQKYKNKDLQNSGYQKFEQKQIKKQKKGLANISLRVKNIVSEHKKLTYKQVSDLVLQYSKDQIDQLEESQKIRQIKNIKRRVYDALNVLVAVGILGKHQRCVCMTQWTNIPGKKHSQQWQKINNKIDYIAKLKKNCGDKTSALNLLVDKYNAIAALRIKHADEIKHEKKEQNAEFNFQAVQSDKKLEFPVIIFCPSFNQQADDKLTVELEEGQYQSNQIQKMKISGKNLHILGDFDCALELNLEKYRNLQKQKQLQNDIEQFAMNFAKKQILSQKLESDNFCQQNIEEYFNDHVFGSD